MWARRVHSAAYYDNGLALGLASGRGTVFDAERNEGIEPAELSDSGVVRLVKVPNVIAAPFLWPDYGIGRVDAKIIAKEMILSVNGYLIGRRPHDLSIAEIRALFAPMIGRVYTAKARPRSTA